MPAPDERIKSQLGKFNLDTEYLPIFFCHSKIYHNKAKQSNN
jgi:hypothetical protein